MKKYLPALFHSAISALFLVCINLLLPFPLYSQDWNNCGGNSSRNGLSPITGPDAPTILWQGTQPGLFGFPIYIEENRLVTSRFVSLTNSPVVCHDIYTGDTLWTADVTGGLGRSIPIGMRDGRVYVMRYQEGPEGDSLIALDASTGAHLWTAEKLIRPATMVGCVFASNGDLIVEGNQELLRIDATDGSTVWSTMAIPWVFGWLSPAIFGNTVYVQQNSFESITAIDITTGDTEYSHAVSPLGGNAQTDLMVGADGVIYAQTTGPGGEITALKDNGDSLSILWTTPTSGYSVFCLMGESPDSTIYVPSNGKILRLLKTTGAILDSTDQLGSPSLFVAMVSVGADGKVYIASENTLLCTEADLTPIFTETIPGINTSAAALGPKHMLAISGSGTELRVYKSLATSVNENVNDERDAQVYPNPAQDILFIQTEEKTKHIHCVNLLGQSIALTPENNSIDISSLDPGIYFLDLTTGSGKTIRRTFVKE